MDREVASCAAAARLWQAIMCHSAVVSQLQSEIVVAFVNLAPYV